MRTLRKAQKADIPALIRLLHQVNSIHAQGRPDLFRPDTTKYDEQELGAILDNPQTPVFVCCENDEVQGYAFCVHQRHAGDRLSISTSKRCISTIFAWMNRRVTSTLARRCTILCWHTLANAAATT
ncbi:hypothetical protein [uncultured Dubosiella sp.]|uniref:hypothetical protein n=1 Tax=uncultured Dubosiella sp. TaxID=1937011 RepID=UPI003390166A